MRNREYRNWQGSDAQRSHSQRDSQRDTQRSDTRSDTQRADRSYQNDSANFDTWDDGRIEMGPRARETYNERNDIQRTGMNSTDRASYSDESMRRYDRGTGYYGNSDWRSRDYGTNYGLTNDFGSPGGTGNYSSSASSSVDWTSRQGPHSGKGPKGYRKSDERIQDEVCDVLSRHALIDASEIEVQVQDGEVILSGTVQERAQKRYAEDAVEYLAGVRDVKNQLRIQARDASQSSTSEKADVGSDKSDRPSTNRKTPVHA